MSKLSYVMTFTLCTERELTDCKFAIVHQERSNQLQICDCVLKGIQLIANLLLCKLIHRAHLEVGCILIIGSGEGV